MRDRRLVQAWALVGLTVLVLGIGFLAGGWLGARATKGGDGFEDLVGALAGIVIGIPAAAIILAGVWAVVCKRVWWIPPLAMLLIYPAATIFWLQSLGETNATAITVTIVILAATLALVFVVGRFTPPSRKARAAAQVANPPAMAG